MRKELDVGHEIQMSMLKALKLLKQKDDGGIALCNANEQIQEVLEITGFSP